MQYTYSSSNGLTFSLVALLVGGCSLGSVAVSGGFRDGEEEGGESQSSGEEKGGGDTSSGDTSSGDTSSGDTSSGADTTDETASSSGGALPEDEPPVDPGGPLHAAFLGCAFNGIWTEQNPSDGGNGRGFEISDVAFQDDTRLEFVADSLNFWVLGMVGDSSVQLELLEIDAVTGEFVIAAQVVSEVQLLTLPTIRIDPADPFLLYDAVPQDPAAAGMATMKYLEDNTEASYEQRWGLTVSLNASTNPACEAYLEEIYGPF